MRSLEDLRREIDEIDDAIHDLIMRRAALLGDIAAAKGAAANGPSGTYLRPAREALVLRRLIERHRGQFPKPALVRLWRELISAPLSLQGAFTAAVYAPDEASGYWDLARDHYGSHTAFVRHHAVGQVIAALGDGSAVVGILPAIQAEDADPWWQHLIRDDDKGPRIAARLPFAGAGNARDGQAEALVVGAIVPEPTGRDRSYIAVEIGGELSRTKLRGGLKRSGLEPRLFASWQPSGEQRRLHLVEIDDFIAPNDARIADFSTSMAGMVDRVYFLGSYALPFSDKELA
ncbi:MAG TPA: chorismate mutase [Alphaproteobacteria bacterium]|nr:chorismate mutase [Alphaproteobacteria bacterium]